MHSNTNLKASPPPPPPQNALYVVRPSPDPTRQPRLIPTINAPPPNNRPIIISGLSGVGKGTLIEALLTNHPNTFALTTSHTTRKPHPGEIDGVDYQFVSPCEFSTLISQDAFIEHAVFSGHHYGTSKRTIAEKTAKGLIIVLDIEVNDIRQIKANSSSDGGDVIDARYVLMKPVSLEALEVRLRGRGTKC